MKSFCVECGREAEVYEGLCAECLPKKRHFLVLPSTMDLAYCPHCGRYQPPGGWRDTSLEDALRGTVDQAAKVPREVHGLTIELDATPTRAGVVEVEATATLKIDGLELQEVHEVTVRLRGTTCPDCAKQHGAYYEAVLQVRAHDRSLTEEEVRQARDLISNKVAGTSGLFVTREEAVHGGLDVYLSQNEAAKALTKSLRARLGGQGSSSPKLHTRKDGKDVYRVTYALRLPRLSAGDVFEHDGHVYWVRHPGENLRVLDLESGEEKGIASREVLTTSPLEASVVPGVIIAEEAGEVQVMDAKGYRVRHVARPPELALEGEDVTLILTDRGDFIAPASSSQ